MSDTDPFDWTQIRPGNSAAAANAADPLELTEAFAAPAGQAQRRVPLSAPPPAPAPPPPAPPPEAYTTNLPAPYRGSRWRWVSRGIALVLLLVIAAIAWLAVTAPLSKSLEPLAPPSIRLLAADGTPIAQRGAIQGAPVDAAKLPKHVTQAFLAIEDRRFYSHWGIDLWGIGRALYQNFTSGGVKQGGSTITQQLAKNAFLDADRTFGRKFQEVLISFWLEAWLSKDEILSRYLSNVYFGDNVYGLTAAARHYFSTTPEDLSIAQAAMLAGLVQAPSRLAPTGNLKGARDRQALVVAAMADAGFLSKAEARRVRPAVLKPDKVKQLPNGTYFADWVLPQARDRAGEIVSEQSVETTLEMRLQKAAERAVGRIGLGSAQAALVAMRPDGRVVAMVGGKKYADSPFNRATQARRQPGSTFKLFVYLAALRSGMTPDTMVDDTPVRIGDWAPENSDGRYEGRITLRRAFAKSSNVVAARLTRDLGVAKVTKAARDLGISTPIGTDASIGLGTSTVSLLELTAAYAAIDAGAGPVRPRGLPDADRTDSWLARAGGEPLGARELAGMRDLLAAAVSGGTGRAAALSIDAYGKTGTTQDSRDVLFVGYARDLIVGVWVGNDDNSPNRRFTSALPARIWRDFMVDALGITPPAPPPSAAEPDEASDGSNETVDLLEGVEQRLGVDLPELPVERRVRTPFGDVDLGGGGEDRDRPRDDRAREREAERRAAEREAAREARRDGRPQPGWRGARLGLESDDGALPRADDPRRRGFQRLERGGGDGE